MTTYLKEILNRIDKDNGKTFNLLVGKGIIDYKEVLVNLLKEGTDEELYKYLKLVNKLTNEEKELIFDELIRRKSLAYLCMCANEIECAPIEKIERVIIDSKLPGYIRLFARTIKGANIHLLEDAIIEVGNAESIYFFAKENKEINIDKLTNAIIEKNTAKYIFLFANYVPGANMYFLEEALINIGDIDVYKEFLEYKESVQNKIFTDIYDSINSNNLEDLELNKEKYASLFKEPSSKAKALIKKINDRGY